MITRRRMLTLTAAALGSIAVSGSTANARAYRWRGHALGGPASMILYDDDGDRAHDTVDACVSEIERLETEFSLYRADSSLRRLNRDGVLAPASMDIRHVFELARLFAEQTNGAFDVTVQPLWEVYARTDAPSPRDHSRALARTGFGDVTIDNGAVRFRRRGMSATLNGIAQGYITDKIAELLTGAGYCNVLIDLGEIRAIGPKADGAPWHIGLPGGRRHALARGAVATSATGQVGNILLDPRTGLPAARYQWVNVFAATATEADALSTAFSVMSADEIAAAVKGRAISAVTWGANGTTTITGGGRPLA